MTLKLLKGQRPVTPLPMGLFLILMVSLTLSADIEEGKDVYLQNCANCHSITMAGGMGPDFNLVSYKRRRADVAKYIEAPGMHYRAFGYTANAMPTLPLSPKEIEDVSHYIDSLQPFKEWMKK